MLTFILFVLLLGLLLSMYKRYIPVSGVPRLAMANEFKQEHVTYLDVRDYNIADQYPVKGVFQLPYAYLKRHYGEINNKAIVVVASDQLLLNLSVRFLRRKGFDIVGCYLTEGEELATKPASLKNQKRVPC